MFKEMTEQQRQEWVSRFCDYAEASGGYFPHGRPDGRPTREQRASQEAKALNNPLSGDTL